MRKYGIWRIKQKIMLTDFDITEYRKRIWNLEKWFTRRYGGGKTLSVGGGNAPFGDISCDPLLPRDVECVGEFLPFRPKSFDTILIYSVLDHCLDPVKLLKECKNVGNKILIMQTIIPFHIEILTRLQFFISKKKLPTINNIDPCHMRHYTFHSLIKHLIKAKLIVTDCIIVFESGYCHRFLAPMIAFISAK